MKAWLFVIVAAILCTFSVGCGKSGPIASGNVTFDGQPVEIGMIMFVPIDDKRMTPDSGKIVDGKFSVVTKPGKKRVVIHASRPGPIDPVMKSPVQVEYIPEQYNAKSTLTKEITDSGDNQFDFPLTSDGK
jgi:hypothetical protein